MTHEKLLAFCGIESLRSSWKTARHPADDRCRPEETCVSGWTHERKSELSIGGAARLFRQWWVLRLQSVSSNAG
jgi:hypothetical protein